MNDFEKIIKIVIVFTFGIGLIIIVASVNAELEIRGKDNVIDFLNYISKRYYFMYLSK